MVSGGCYAAADLEKCVGCGLCEKAVPGRCALDSYQGGTAMKKKHWYDYLWIWSIIYFTLGFFNILFAWLGMSDFLVPVFIAVFGRNKWFCNNLCGRGQLFALLGKI